MLEFTFTESFVLAAGSMLAGMIMLIKGGGKTIDAAVFLAARWGISPLLIGFTVIAFGTSLPEMLVSVLANLGGLPGIAVGNVIGSNIANILLVIGLTACFVTLKVFSNAIFKDLAMMMVATIALLLLLTQPEIGRMTGGLMIVFLAGYVALQYKMALRGELPADIPDDPIFKGLGVAAIHLTAGLVMIAVGAQFLVSGAKVSAEIIGVPDAVIALSIIAFGTSLPELSTCLIAAKRGEGELVLGNVIGSNVFNILMIMGASLLARPIATAQLAPQLLSFDIWVLLGLSLVFTLGLLLFRRVGRAAGIVFVALYGAYNIVIYALYM